MKKLKTSILITLLATNLMSSDVELNKDFYEFDIKSEKMVVIDFPFVITDKKLLGDRNNIEGDSQEKSIYLKVTSGSVDLTVWGGEKPILITLTAKPEGQRKISFFNKKDIVAELKKDNKEWNHDLKVAEQIETYSKTGSLSGFEKVDIGSDYITPDGRLEVTRVERYANESNYAFEKLLVTNNSNQRIDLFEKKELYFTSRDNFVIDSVSVDNRYLIPGQRTVCYLGLEKVK